MFLYHDFYSKRAHGWYRFVGAGVAVILLVLAASATHAQVNAHLVIEYPNLNITESAIDRKPLGSAIVGGEVYRGELLSELEGGFVFADYSANPNEPSGQVFLARPTENIGALWNIEPVLQLEARAQGMGMDNEGELYVLTRESFGPTGDTGKVFKLVPASATASSSANESARSESNVNSNENANTNAEPEDSGTQSETSTSGVFTTAQAERGAGLYQEHCQSCHSQNLQGSSPFPPITGQSFFSDWNGRSISELQQYLRENMPLGSAGSLSDQVYADITAYWLSRHGYGAGNQSLPADPENSPGLPIEDRRD